MDHLFVYGTLRRAARDSMGAMMRARLHRESTLVGDATMPGRLFDLGDYPGMVEAEPRERGQVLGEVLMLQAPDITFGWLDRYEDVKPSDPATGLYRRVPQLALLKGGGTVRCWVYVLNSMPGQDSLIANGCWLTHFDGGERGAGC